MNRKEFTDAVTDMMQTYTGNERAFDNNPQLRVNPMTLDATVVDGRDMLAEIADADETLEASAAAEGSMSEEAADYQDSRTPDFYPVFDLLRLTAEGIAVPDASAIDAVADVYFSKTA